jgi:isocitrate lyase
LRWSGVQRGYTAADVVRLRGQRQPEYSFARLGAGRLWSLLHGSAKKGYINCLGTVTGGQAIQKLTAARLAADVCGVPTGWCWRAPS